MKVLYVTYARVAAGAAAPATAVLRPKQGLDDFLFGHLRAMRELAATDKSPFATFVDTRAGAYCRECGWSGSGPSMSEPP